MIKILENLNEAKHNNLEDYFNKHGIKPLRDIHTSSIGFSEKEQKWYGFSHRAICGFKIGDKCKGDLGLGDGYTFKEGDILKTLDDCKQRAIDYAKSVD